jgi:transcriptional regulator with XRE-family HTH domain
MQRLKKRLADSGTNQKHLAHVLGISQAVVSDWVQGRGAPSILRLRAIAVFTGLSVAALVADVEADALARGQMPR